VLDLIVNLLTLGGHSRALAQRRVSTPDCSTGADARYKWPARNRRKAMIAESTAKGKENDGGHVTVEQATDTHTTASMSAPMPYHVADSSPPGSSMLPKRMRFKVTVVETCSQ
jgi:hypothetical protein